MRKLKWMVLGMLALPIATNIKASTCNDKCKAAPVVKHAQTVSAPATLIDLILFPHGM